MSLPPCGFDDLIDGRAAVSAEHGDQRGLLGARARRAGLGLATIWLSGCATGASDVGGLGACPPVVEYSREFQVRAGDEMVPLPEGSAIAEMMSD